jgi:PAS domain S-box-containing protein
VKPQAEKPAVRQITLQPDLSEVGRAREFLREIGEALELPPSRLFDMTVACSEALANAIEHSVSKGQARLKAAVFSDRLEVQVEGPGEFHPPSSCRDRSHRGLGLPLMAHLSDHLALYSKPNGGTLVSMTFYRGDRPPQAEETVLPPTILELIEENELTSGIAGTVPVGICVLDPELRFRWANPAFLSFLHYAPSGPQVIGSPFTSVIPQLAGATVVERLRAVTETGAAESASEVEVSRADGSTGWWRGNALPLYGDKERPPYDVLLVVSDETERKLHDQGAEWRGRRDELLSRTAARLLESRDPQGLVDELCADVMAFLDCQVFFNYLGAGEGVEALSLNAYAGIPAGEAVAIGLLPRGTAVCGCVARDGERIIAEDIQNTDDPLTALVRGYGVQAYCCHPLTIHGQTIGTLSFGTRTRTHFAPEEVEVMSSVANLVATAMHRLDMEQQLQEGEERYRKLFEEHERLYHEQLEIAQKLQAALVHLPADVGPVRLSHLYRSATEAARVGGDFYDAFRVRDGRLVVLIGDVSGHGVEAARLAHLTKDVIRAFAGIALRPGDVFSRTNRLLLEEHFGGFVSVFLGILDPDKKSLVYVSAGHPDAMLRRSTGEMVRLCGNSAPLGVNPEAAWASSHVNTGPGDLLFLYTDGVTEARRDGQLFGEDRLQDLVSGHTLDVDELPRAVLDSVLEFSGHRLRDDVAIMAMSLTGR